MIHQAAIYFIAAMGILTYVLELWTGCAVAGWSGEKSLIHRTKSPGPYWFVMAFQAFIVVVLSMSVF